MNPGPLEEGGKALHTIGDVMKSQPLAFGFLVTNLMWIAFFFWFASTLRERNTAERKYFQQIVENCRPDLFKPTQPKP